MTKTTMLIAISGALVALPAWAADGKAVYAQTCAVCHAAGVAGAPKLEDKGAWKSRLAAGKEALVSSVIKGKGAMPANGGNGALSDADIWAAVDFMLGQAK